MKSEERITLMHIISIPVNTVMCENHCNGYSHLHCHWTINVGESGLFILAPVRFRIKVCAPLRWKMLYYVSFGRIHLTQCWPFFTPRWLASRIYIFLFSCTRKWFDGWFTYRNKMSWSIRSNWLWTGKFHNLHWCYESQITWVVPSVWPDELVILSYWYLCSPEMSTVPCKRRIHTTACLKHSGTFNILCMARHYTQPILVGIATPRILYA